VRIAARRMQLNAHRGFEETERVAYFRRVLHDARRSWEPALVTSAAAPALRNFRGSCHCGALAFSFLTPLAVPQWSVRACQCRFCRAHGARTTSDPEGRLMFQVGEVEALQRYRFGLRTADFLLCSRCGVYIGAQIETAHGAFGIVNTRAMLPAAAELPAAAPVDYGSESSSERAARREQRWTPLERVV
jgi:hypothetical protein